MAPEVLAAMAEAARVTVELPALQAAASRRHHGSDGGGGRDRHIGRLRRAAAGRRRRMARLDPGAMNRLPDTEGMPNEFVAVRSQRNMYDRRHPGGRRADRRGRHPDRISGPGVRDAAPWEIADAIGPRNRRRSTGWPGRTASPRCPKSPPSQGRAASPCWSMPRRNCRRGRTCGASSPRAPTCLLLRRQGAGRAAGQRHPGRAARPGQFGAAADARPRPAGGAVRAAGGIRPAAQLRGLPDHGIGRSWKAGKEEIVGLYRRAAALRRRGPGGAHRALDRAAGGGRARRGAAAAAPGAGRRQARPAAAGIGACPMRTRRGGPRPAAAQDRAYPISMPPCIRDGILAVEPDRAGGRGSAALLGRALAGCGATAGAMMPERERD